MTTAPFVNISRSEMTTSAPILDNHHFDNREGLVAGNAEPLHEIVEKFLLLVVDHAVCQHQIARSREGRFAQFSR